MACNNGNGLQIRKDCANIPNPVIIGNNNIYQNNLQIYSTTAINGATYNWIIINGSIQNGQETNQITVL